MADMVFKRSGVSTNWIEHTQEDVYNTRDMFFQGRHVVALAFINAGTSTITVQNKFVLQPKQVEIIPIPTGCADADLYQWSFPDIADQNKLIIKETVAIRADQV